MILLKKVVKMTGALYIHDPVIRTLVEDVKNELGLKSLSETVEKAVLKLRDDYRVEPCIDDKIAQIQNRFKLNVVKNNSSLDLNGKEKSRGL